jgi:hypothetical protein
MAFKVDGFGTNEDLKRIGLRVQELRSTRQEFLLCRVVSGCKRAFRADDIKNRDGVRALGRAKQCGVCFDSCQVQA